MKASGFAYWRNASIVLGPIFHLAIGAPALAQTRAPPFVAPPRTIADITAILDQEKPDPKLLAKLRGEADAPPPTGASKAALATFYYNRAHARVNLGHNRDATTDAERAVQYAKGVVKTEELGRLLFLLGLQYMREGAPKKALEIFLRLVQEAERGGRKGWLFTGYRWISRILIDMGDFTQAESYVRKGQALLQESRSWSDQRFRTGWALNAELASAGLYDARGELREAEASYRRAEALGREWVVRSVGLPGVPPQYQLLISVDGSVAYGGRVKARQGRLAEGEADVRRALLSRLKGGASKYDIHVAAVVAVLADMMIEQGRYAEAEKLTRTAIEILRTLGHADDSQGLASSLHKLGSVLNLQGKWPEAANVYDAVDVATKTWDVARRENLRLNIGLVFTLYNTNNIDAGIAAAERLLARQRSLLGDQNPETAATRGLLAIGLARAGRDAEALREFRVAIPVLMSASRETDSDDAIVAAAREQRAQMVIEAYIALLARTAPAREQAAIESFGLAEAIRGRSVQKALSASSARMVVKDPALAELARKEQDLEKQVTAQLGVLNNVLALPPEQRDDKATRALQAEIEKLRTARVAARKEMQRRFPNYADLTDPKPPAVEDIRAVLKPQEAFLSFYFGREASFVWAVPQVGAVALAAIRTDAGQLEAKVKQLRDQLEAKADTLDEIPPFDTGLAHELYELLLKPVEQAWRPAKSLIVATNGALGYLPLSLLPTRPEAPKPEQNAPLFSNYRNVPWLARSHAVTMVPSAAALRTLRQLPPGSARREKLIGFGDPYFSVAQAAEAAQGTASEAQSVVAMATGRGLRFPRRAASQTRGIDSADLALLPRLPDTADELRSVARALSVDPAKVLNLGRDANERKVKGSDLSRYGIVAFATHGLVPGDLNGLTQPALALTAPEVADIDGDGLLTMEEVLALKLDADWVVLSACNTGAGAGAGAEAVSGLGRAFFYAGTRTLLVTNWSVYSAPATEIVTDIFRRQAADPKLTRAEGLRQAMMALLDGPGFTGQDAKTLFSYAHPVFWAPYTIIGDGG
jgi:CHAT domain-containing protein